MELEGRGSTNPVRFGRRVGRRPRWSLELGPDGSDRTVRRSALPPSVHRFKKYYEMSSTQTPVSVLGDKIKSEIL